MKALFVILTGIFVIFIIFSFFNSKNLLIINSITLNHSISNKIVPKICEKRVFEINLSKNQILFFENCKLKEIIPIAYQAPEGKWYQTPTGYFRVGIKKEKHISSLFPVYMNYAVQMHEDFFIHEIPIYLNGERVTNNFSGGCIRLETEYAKRFFNIVKTGDLIVSYKELNPEKFKKDFHPPVNLNEFYIRQRFNNPLRAKWDNAKNTENRKNDYIQHAGIDLAPEPFAKDLNAYAIYDGKIVKIVKNGEEDHGLGNVVIMEIDNLRTYANDDRNLQKFIVNNNVRISSQKFAAEKLYVLYAHLSEIKPQLKEGDFIKKGQIIGKIGATGYGCNYWRIGKDGCNENSPLDTHLHLEIKTGPLLESPVPAECFVNGAKRNCYGYTPDNPEKYGYLNPITFLFEEAK